MQVKTNGVTYFVDLHQQDEALPNLILLHGFMGSGRIFSSLIEHLSTFCNPITIDLLGHGKTSGAASPKRFAEKKQVADLKEIIQQITGKSTFLHGYSMGGRLALRYALRHPETLRGLILESTNYGLEEERKINQRQQTDEERAQEIECNFESFLEDWQTLPIFENGISLPQEKLDFYAGIQQKQDAGQMAKSLRGFGTAQMPSVRTKLVELQLPVLIAAGQADLKYAQIGRQMHKLLPESTMTIIPNAGHRVHYEHPKALAAEIKSFIN